MEVLSSMNNQDVFIFILRLMLSRIMVVVVEFALVDRFGTN